MSKSLVRRLLWPTKLIALWLVAWVTSAALEPHLGRWGALALVTIALAVASLTEKRPWRRLALVLGFAVACLVSFMGGALNAVTWLGLLAIGLLVYPVRAWQDAPLFPTPADCLLPMTGAFPGQAGWRVLDAGSGLGDGLIALRRAYPTAQIEGIEMSWVLRFLCRLRCPWARLRPGDMWRLDWSSYALVYLFQRPESMPKAIGKAREQMRPGALLVSYQFAVPSLAATWSGQNAAGKWLYVYQI